LELLLTCALLGIFAGLVAGLLGVGGGLVIVPVLAMLFAGGGFPEGRIMQLAVGTSLATIVFTSISSVRAHHRHGAVLWPVFRRLTPGIVVGAWLGAAIAGALPSDRLRLFFGLFELYVAIQMALDRAVRGHPDGAGHPAPAPSAAAGADRHGAGRGHHRPGVGHRGDRIVAGWGDADLPAGSVGYLYLPALAAIAVTSVLFAPLGARLAHRLPVKTLKRIFALLLFALAGKMLLG